MNNYVKALLINGLIVATTVTAVYGLSLLPKKSSNLEVKKEIQVSKKAPLFTGTDSYGKEQSLDQYKGKIVVLEWTNHKCPFVRKFYRSGYMQTLQKEYTDQGIVWLSIISSAPGKQGHVSGEECHDIIKKEQSYATAVILDEQGDIGRLYQAKTTPYMVIIDEEGELRYRGAIDSIRSADSTDITKATNYVKDSIMRLRKNLPIEVKETSSYGCSVKY
ncbi:thioredoxin family protein [Candidatus Marinamargulisbacteria bacterium SCGC AG-343-D04]|nr:thioredoxin family protein [Candidatus Marinamargulisbacteria bacterium SCGC AG-343-D04]